MSRQFIDVRETYEFQISHVQGAINIPLSKLMSVVDTVRGISKDAEIVVYCRTGSRSKIAMNILKQNGYMDITDGVNQSIVKAEYFT